MLHVNTKTPKKRFPPHSFSNCCLSQRNNWPKQLLGWTCIFPRLQAP